MWEVFKYILNMHAVKKNYQHKPLGTQKGKTHLMYKSRFIVSKYESAKK